MRSTAEALQAFETIIGRYLMELESLDMEQLIKKPNEEEWSIGQMYMHLIQSAQFMHLHNVDQCLAGSEATVGTMEEKTERGKGAFELGSFPPVRIQVPASPQYTPKQPESKEQLKEGFLSIVERMKNTEPTLSKVPESRKILHPGFGALNANEWFLLIEMHYRHHLSQLERLKNFWEITYK
ncbi:MULTISPECIES: DinB family protein [Paenibacillus]|uniref:DinB family protein n=1 Tax=Paenibacillus violae TaxID=3077234 RepID=A0ABU3R9C9_9BACL|nr:MULTISPECIES: DinB family protein [Paenibacillus]MDU0200871.1 DinB family protein [Paenibacillus sp. PFR10]MEC0264730.1 DinB family protein [Paenibacillus anseongense]